MTNIDLSGKSYKEIQATYTTLTGYNAVGKKRAELEAAIIQEWTYVEDEVVVEDIKMTDAELVQAASEEDVVDSKPVAGIKRGYEHETKEIIFKSLSAHIRYLFFVEGLKQAAIAKQLMVVPQMVSNVVRAEIAKRAEAAAEGVHEGDVPDDIEE